MSRKYAQNGLESLFKTIYKISIRNIWWLMFYLHLINKVL